MTKYFDLRRKLFSRTKCLSFKMSFGIYFIICIINTYYKRTEYSNNIYSSNFLCYAVCESMTKNRNKGDELSTKINED